MLPFNGWFAIAMGRLALFFRTATRIPLPMVTFRW
jgi:hypothetical protein